MGAKLFLVVLFGALFLEGQIASGKPHFGKTAEINKLEVDAVPTTALPAAPSADAAAVNLPAKQEAIDAPRNKRQDLKSENGARPVMRQAADEDITDRLQRVITDLLAAVKDLVEISHSQSNSHVASKLNVANGPSNGWPIVLSQTSGWEKR